MYDSGNSFFSCRDAVPLGPCAKRYKESWAPVAFLFGRFCFDPCRNTGAVAFDVVVILLNPTVMAIC